MKGNADFRRFFAAQAGSSLGDWIGVIAIAVYAQDLGGSLGVGVAMTARVLPGFVIGPLAGVLADRYDRRRLMVAADLMRAALIFSLPFIPNLIYLLLVSAVLESLTLLWGPAKDASLPHFVSASELPHANSLSLIAVYAPWPVAALIYSGLSTLGITLGQAVPLLAQLTDRPEFMALWVDSATFCLSALLISTLSIPTSRRKHEPLDLGEVKRDLLEGLSFIRDHAQVRPWMLGIATVFAAAGGVFSLGPEFAVDVLRADDRAFALVIGTFGTGMIAGLLASGFLSRRVSKDVMLSSSILLLGGGLLAFSSMGSLDAALPIAGALGFFGGVGYSTAYALLQVTTEDALRGRTFSAAYTIIRVGTLVGLGIFPFVAEALGDHSIGSWPLPGSRLTLWVAGIVVFAGGIQSMRAIRARRPEEAAHERRVPGRLVVFEGGEGAGKTTQMEALVRWLRARGEDVVMTREPGGTRIGERIRDLVLDPDLPEMDPRTEALLYAADRAQHVAEVIAPAIKEGKIVVSDRFVDSSLAYQGLARGLGLQEIYEISSWATGGVFPDLVFFMNVDADEGMSRGGAMRDRIEREGEGFHERVGAAYMQLAERFVDRFVVIDAHRPKSEIHEDIVALVEAKVLDKRDEVPVKGSIRPPGTPVPR